MLIHTATYTEAKELIKRLELKRADSRLFKIYQNEAFILIISGIGKIDAAAATAYALTRYPHIEKAVNFGSCAAKREFQLGQLLNAKKIVDMDDHKVYRSSICDGLPNITIGTYSEPATKSKFDAADMEASAFAKVCIRFGVEFRSFKIVSDWFEPNSVSSKLVQSLILDNIDEISNILISQK